MTRTREELPQVEGPERVVAPAVSEPQLLSLQRSAGNQAVARWLARQPDLTVKSDPQAVASERVLIWFTEVATRLRQTEPGSRVQSVAELVYIAGRLDLGQGGKVRDRMKPAAIEQLLRNAAREQGVQLLDHRPLDDPRGLAAEAAAIFGNLDRIPTELTFGGDESHITISIGGKVSAAVGALKLEGESLPEGGAKGKASIKGDAGEVEIHGSPEGVGTSFKRGKTKVGVDLGKGIKAEVKAGDLVTVKGAVTPEGNGKVGWSAQITISTLGGSVLGAQDIAKVMGAAQDTFASSGSALASDLGVEEVVKHGPLLKKAVTDVAEKAKKSAAQNKPGVAVGVSAKGDSEGGYGGSVTLTWVF